MMKGVYLGGGVREGENERMLVVLGHFLTDLRDGLNSKRHGGRRRREE
jgi:hypothetical protein